MVGVYLEIDKAGKLYELAKKQGKPVSVLLREIINKYLEEAEKREEGNR